MKYTQLLLQFGNTVLRHIRRRPDQKPTGGKRPSLQKDPILEDLCRQLVDAAGCRGLKVSVYWNSRLRTTAGLACWQTKTISLNPKLIELSPDEVQRTLRHELSHFVAQYRAGRKRIQAHGEEWRQACCDLGIAGEPRCHDLPFKRRKVERKHFYACRECGTVLARVRPVRGRVACLRCCRKHNGGKYHERFRFVQTATPERIAA